MWASQRGGWGQPSGAQGNHYRGGVPVGLACGAAAGRVGVIEFGAGDAVDGVLLTAGSVAVLGAIGVP